MKTEDHRSMNTGWLRAAVLGANDGIISTASLLVGVASAHASHQTLLITGISGLAAGSMSMAAGEYVSVSSQADTEAADLALESLELEEHPKAEQRELTEIYVERGLTRELAKEVSIQLMAKDALGAHARDELGITEISSARPLLAAWSSAISFSIGASVPLLAAVVSPHESAALIIFASVLMALLLLGLFSAKASGTKPLVASVRVVFWGAIAMGVTALIGKLSGHAV